MKVLVSGAVMEGADAGVDSDTLLFSCNVAVAWTNILTSKVLAWSVMGAQPASAILAIFLKKLRKPSQPMVWSLCKILVMLRPQLVKLGLRPQWCSYGSIFSLQWEYQIGGHLITCEMEPVTGLDGVVEILWCCGL